MIFRIVCLLVSVFVGNEVASQNSCDLKVSQQYLQPIVLDTQTSEFFYPSRTKDVLTVNNGQSVFLSCPGGIFYTPNSKEYTTAQATCTKGKLLINKENINFESLACSLPETRTSGKVCSRDGKEIEIGFKLDKNQFSSLINVCFDKTTQIAYYTYFKLSLSIGYSQRSTFRPYFLQDNHYTIKDVNSLYIRSKQKATINGLLGLPANSQKYISDTNNYFLSRGHLAANADFVFGVQQRATFRYINTAPQWQTLNVGNWQTIEKDVRDYAQNKKVDLDIYTGTYGIAELPHEKSQQAIPLYMYIAGNQKSLPVPDLFWKIVYEPTSQRGVVLLSANNPYKKSIAFICPDVSTKVNWLTWDTKNQQKGYSYACEVNQFKQKVPHAPDLIVKGLLV